MRDKEPKTISIEHPGQGFWEQIDRNGKMWYAFYNPPDQVFPTERIHYDGFNPGELKKEYRIIYKPIKKCPWPLAGEPLEPGENLWKDVHDFIYLHLDLPDARLYDVMTAWIMATWISEAWNVVPYLFFHGPIASGKTRALEVLRALCYRALMGCNMSESAVFRAVESWKPTVILDETEIYTREGKTAIQNLLNSGYRRGQYAIRVRNIENDSPQLDLFDVFGFKALAGTEGFKQALESRSIMINMEKNVRKIRFTIDTEKAREIRSRLLLWRWRQLSNVSSVSSVFLEDAPKMLGFTNGRLMELFASLVSIANHGRRSILSYARDMHQWREDEEKASEEARILESILKSWPYVEKGRFPTSAVTEKYNEGLSERERWGSRTVGRYIKRLGFKPKALPDSQRGWIWDEDRIKRLCKRYGINPTIPRKTLETLETLENGEPEETTQNRDFHTKSVREITEAVHEYIGGDIKTDREIADYLGFNLQRTRNILGLMEKDGASYQPRPGCWRLTD